MSPRSRRTQSELYDVDRSPFSQRPTQRRLAELLHEPLKDLRTISLPSFKEQFVKRRSEETGKKKKMRDLFYPTGRLRLIHEKLKYHLNKIKQPYYLLSPRKGKSQRDNALIHLEKNVYLVVDLKQFYPSTTSAMVRNWLSGEMKMYGDVAALLTRLATIDEKVSFGSPLTPVLCSLVHRRMFNEVADLCDRHNLEFSLWVDDLTISGNEIKGQFIDELRGIIASYGLKSHKLHYRTGNRPVYVTGVGIVGRKLVAPNAMNLKLKDLWSRFYMANNISEKIDCMQALLTLMGSVRYIVGKNTQAGRDLADRMNSLRQKRERMQNEQRDNQEISRLSFNIASLSLADNSELPFDL